MGDIPEAAENAKLLLANACGFYLAATRIADAGVGPDFPWPPFFVNIGHVFELSLKAYVVHHGGSEKVCKDEIGHDLFRAIDEACARGLSRPSEDVVALVSRIASYHRGHNFRYMTTPIDVPSLPDAVHTLAVTNGHLISIAAQLGDLLPVVAPPHEDSLFELPQHRAQAGAAAAQNSERASGSTADHFSDEIARERARILEVVAAATERYESELAERFADDLRVKQRLSDFARANNLDSALTALWNEIKHYPAWSQRDDFDKWNTLNLSGIAGTKADDTEAVEFVHDDRRFGVVRRMWSGEDNASYADFTLIENDEEVFAISCAVEDDGYRTRYACFDIRGFKKRGVWAKVLLHYYGEILNRENRLVAECGYPFADEIQERFEE
jgi:hypothetical protein